MSRPCRTTGKFHQRLTHREKLFTFVRADNPDALAAYRANGFRVIGTAARHARVDGRYVDEVLIERALGETAQATPA